MTTDEALDIDLSSTYGRGLARHKMIITNKTVNIAPVPSICSNGDTGIDQEKCTGFTGFIYTPSSCSNNPLYDNNEAACVANSDPSAGVFSPAKCTRPTGEVISDDGTGYASSHSSCVGSDNGLGHIFTPEIVPTEFDLLDNSDAEIIHLGTGNVFSEATSAMCKDSLGNVVGPVPYTDTSATCTGLTGFTFIPAAPSSCTDPVFNNDENGCVSNGHSFTQAHGDEFIL